MVGFLISCVDTSEVSSDNSGAAANSYRRATRGLSDGTVGEASSCDTIGICAASVV